MSSTSYDILNKLGSLIIWVSKGFNGSYLNCQQNKYTFEVGLEVVVLVIFILYFTEL